jgi:glycosyltransferase involved in cell wall biosynthesis
MRVLYVNQTAQVSGAERSLLALVEGIREVVDPVAACPEGELAGALRGLGLSPTTIPGTDASFRLHPRHTSRALVEIACSSLALRRVVERLAPDVVHANTTRAAMLSLTLQGPPIVAHIRDWVPPGHVSRLVLGAVGRRAHAVVANSRYVAGQFEGLPLRAPVSVVHNPVDLAQFDPAAVDDGEARRGLDLDESAVVLAVVAQLTPWKGQDDAIRVLAHLAGGGRDVVLLLAGSAKFTAPGTRFDNLAYARRLRTLASELRVNERVRFLGERSDVPRVLAAADVLLLPSWREAFGRIAIEAMAMGLPVAATEVGGPSEIVRAGVDGLLLPPREPELWARGLEPLVDDAGLRRQMGKNGRRKALQSFSVEAHTAALLAVYEDLAQRGAGETREPGRRATQPAAFRRRRLYRPRREADGRQFEPSSSVGR